MTAVLSALAILAAMGLVILRSIKGPTVQDRILAANAFGTNTVAFILLLAFMVDDMMFLDIALVYALINFITTVALLKYFRHGRLDDGELP